MWALIRDAVIDTGRVGFALIVGVLGTGRGVDRWGGGGQYCGGERGVHVGIKAGKTWYR